MHIALRHLYLWIGITLSESIATDGGGMEFQDPKDAAGRAGADSTRGRTSAVQAVSETSDPEVAPRLKVAKPGLKTSAEMLSLIADRACNIELREAIECLPEGTRVQYLNVKVGVFVGDPDKAQDIRTGFGTVLGLSLIHI